MSGGNDTEIAREVVIHIRVSEEEKDQIQRLAKAQGKTVSEYARDRCLLEWTHRDLEDLGFGLILEKIRTKGYPDDYVKRWVGDLIVRLMGIPVYDAKYEKRMERQREFLRKEGIIR